MSNLSHYVIGGVFVDAEGARRLAPAAKARVDRAKARLVEHLANSPEIRAVLAAELAPGEAVIIRIGGEPFMASGAGVLPVVGGVDE